MSQSAAPLSPMVSLPREPEERYLGLKPTAWLQITIVTILMGALFRFNLWRLWGKTNPFDGQDSNWQHSIFVPLIGIYYLYIHRDELLKALGAKVKPEKGIRKVALIGAGVLGVGMISLLVQGGGDLKAFSAPLAVLGIFTAGLLLTALAPTSNVMGAVFMLNGLLIFAYGIFPGQNDYFKDVGMVITIFGVATLLAGWEIMRIAWFPICFMVVALPWPDQVYSKLAWPLQQLAASAAVGTLRLFGVEAHNFGTKIVMVGSKGEMRTLNVAEVCAGLRSLMTFLMVAGTVAFLSSRPLWEKLLQTLSAIPIAIFCNVVRVAGQGLLDFYVSHELSQNFAHQFVGLIMLIPGFFLILLVGWVMDKLFIDEVDPRRLSGARRVPGKRMIIEVPKKSESLEPDLSAISESAPESPQVPFAFDEHPALDPIAQVAAIPPSALLPSSSGGDDAVADILRPAAGAPAAAHATALSTPAAPPSTLKPSSTTKPPAAPRAGGAESAPQGLLPSAPKAKPAAVPAGSTLKPSSRPAPARPAPPPGGLKPSAPATPRPGAIPQGLLPTPAKPRPAAGGSTAKPAATKPAAPAKPAAPQPPQGGAKSIQPTEGGE